MSYLVLRFRACIAAALVAFAPAAARGGDDVAGEKAKVVVLELEGGYAEDPAPRNPLGPATENFRGLLLKLRKLAADPAVAGVRLDVEQIPDPARSLDLLRELKAVKAAGKKFVCYAETLDQRTLVFASLADYLAVPPSGMVALEGLTIEAMYLKELLALLDVKIHVVHIGNFKTAYEELARESMSDEQRKTIQSILDEYFAQMVDTIAANRGIDRARVLDGFQKLLLRPAEAKDLRLIDAAAYEDEFESACAGVFGRPVEFDEEYGEKDSKEELEKLFDSPFALFTALPKLLHPEQPKLPDAPRIAVVYASGAIDSGKSKMGFDGTVSNMGSETIVEALETALKDDWVKAVVLRVNSPGGSAIASDMIWRAVQRVREKKPVIASMGNVAASGGYWISMGCDRILAQPSTITGSIGVVGMLPDLHETLGRFGVKVEVVGAGPHAAELAMMKDGPSQLLLDTIRTSMLAVYDEFITKASQGRKMNPQVLETLARGRVWTGRQAAELNLIDDLGSYEDAIALACELGGGLDPASVSVLELPEPQNFFDQLQEAFGGMVTAQAQVRRIAAELGFGEAVALAETLIANGAGVRPSTIQAVLPFQFRLR